MAFSSNDLWTIVDQEPNGPCVSLYMPISGSGESDSRSTADKIRLKNLLSRAEEQLEKAGQDDSTSLMEPGHELLRDRSLWGNRFDGLAMFLSDKFFEHYLVPLHFTPFLSVASNYHIRPLLPLVGHVASFHVLALSYRGTRVFRCNPYGVTELELEGIPGHEKDVDMSADEEKQLQAHGGRAGVMFHGHDKEERDEERMSRFCREVDRAVFNLVKDDNAPLVLVGADKLVSRYRSISRVKTILDRTISVHPDEFTGNRLRDMAMPLVGPHLNHELDTDRQRFFQVAGKGNTSIDPLEICHAALHSRVEVLFVVRERQIWANPAGGLFQLAENGSGSVDLLDKAAVETLRTGGRVHVLDREEMPGDSKVAALLRF